MAAQNRSGSVNLFREKQTRDGMGQSHTTERKLQVGFCQHRSRPSISRPNPENDLTFPGTPRTANPRRKLI
jgi:hypothetical protein